jgi:hypothetical protein
MKFLHFDTYLILLFLQHQSDFVSVGLSEARGHYRSPPVMFRLLCPVCRKLVGLGPGATPAHITIRVLHKHTCRSVYTTVPQVTLKDIQTHAVSVRVIVTFDSGPLCLAYTNQDE